MSHIIAKTSQHSGAGYAQAPAPSYDQPPGYTQTSAVVNPAQPPVAGHGQPPVVCYVQTPVASTPPVGPYATTTVCASCHANIVTTVTRSTTNVGHLWAFVLCCMGCWPCCLIPYCNDSCSTSSHSCPNCNAYIGTYVPV